MLTIRTTQKEILAAASFERRLIEHAKKFFPAESARLGADGALVFIRQMVQKACSRGLTRGPDVSSYVDLAFTFGRDFETAPWAAELVAEAAGSWNEFTMDALFEAAFAELDPQASPGLDGAEDYEAIEESEYSDQEPPGNQREGGPDL
jgi:hypothetical protein